MAIITISKNLFEREIGKLDEKMQNQIALFGTPIEKINSEELQLEIFPNILGLDFLKLGYKFVCDLINREIYLEKIE